MYSFPQVWKWCRASIQGHTPTFFLNCKTLTHTAFFVIFLPFFFTQFYQLPECVCVCLFSSFQVRLGNSSFVLIFLTPHWRNIPHSTTLLGVFSRPHCLCVWFKLFSLSYHITSFFLCSFPDHNSPGTNSYSCCQENIFFWHGATKRFTRRQLENFIFPPLKKKTRLFRSPADRRNAQQLSGTLKVTHESSLSRP